MSNSFMDQVKSKLKNIFSGKNSGRSAGIAAALGTAAVTIPVAVALTRKAVSRSYKNILTNRDLGSINKDIIELLRGIMGSDNPVAISICKAVLNSPELLFYESGKANGGGNSLLKNASATPAFLDMIRNMPDRFEGWKDRSVLYTLLVFKQHIIEVGLDYLYRKNFLHVNKGSRNRNPCDRVVVNHGQMGLGVATMIVFLNVFVRLYERYITLADSDGEKATLQVSDEAVDKTFDGIIRKFVEGCQPILQKGESSILNIFRAALGIKSARSVVLLEIAESIGQYQRVIANAVGHHCDKQRIMSVIQKSVESCFIASQSYIPNAFLALMTDSRYLNNRELIQYFLSEGKQLASSSLYLPEKLPIQRMGDMAKKNKPDSVSEDDAQSAAQLIYELSFLQVMCDSLSSLIQNKTTDDNVLTPMYALWLDLISRSHSSMSAVLYTLFDKVPFYKQWKKRHIRVEGPKVVEVPLDPNNLLVEVDSIRQEAVPASIVDPALVLIVQDLNGLPRTFNQTDLRKLVGSIQEQIVQQRRLSTLVLGFEPSEDVDIRPIKFYQLKEEGRFIIDMFAFLIDIEMSHSNSNTFFQMFFCSDISGSSISSFLLKHPILKMRVKASSLMWDEMKTVCKKVELLVNQRLTAYCQQYHLKPSHLKSIKEQFVSLGASYMKDLEQYIVVEVVEGKLPIQSNHIRLTPKRDFLRSEAVFKQVMILLDEWLIQIAALSETFRITDRGVDGTPKKKMVFLDKKCDFTAQPFSNFSDLDQLIEQIRLLVKGRVEKRVKTEHKKTAPSAKVKPLYTMDTLHELEERLAKLKGYKVSGGFTAEEGVDEVIKDVSEKIRIARKALGVRLVDECIKEEAATVGDEVGQEASKSAPSMKRSDRSASERQLCCVAPHKARASAGKEEPSTALTEAAFPVGEGLAIVPSRRAIANHVSRWIFWSRTRKINRVELVLYQVRGAAKFINAGQDRGIPAGMLRILLMALDACAYVRGQYRQSREENVEGILALIPVTSSALSFSRYLRSPVNGRYLSEIEKAAQALITDFRESGRGVDSMYASVGSLMGLLRVDMHSVREEGQFCRNLLLFRMLYYFKAQIDSYNHPEGDLNSLVRRFYRQDHFTRGSLLTSKELAMLEEEGRNPRLAIQPE